MAINGTIQIAQNRGQVVKVKQSDTLITTQTPVTLRNTAADYNAIDRLTDIDLTSRANNSTLVYNSVTNKYEVKPLDTTIISITSLDGGSF